MSNSRPVYSSEEGRLCPSCGKAKAACICKQSTAPPPGDGRVRVCRERKGHGGKTVSVVTGLPLDAAALAALAGELKRRCGCGGTVREGRIEIQGDHADQLVTELVKRGFVSCLQNQRTSPRLPPRSGPPSFRPTKTCPLTA